MTGDAERLAATGVVPIEGVIQPYAWGDRSFIAELLGRPASGEPQAELWLGAHPIAPSGVVGDPRRLDRWIADNPSIALGETVVARFGELPFLAKVLAASVPLSIQAHPSAAQARAGFAREEAAGLPRDHPLRTYRDPNHKPELLAALTDFEAKCGFRSVAGTSALLEDWGHSGLRPLLNALRGRAGRRGRGPSGPAAQQPRAGDDATVLAFVLAWLLRLPREEQASLVAAAVAAAAALPADHPFAPEATWTGRIAATFPGDIGVVVALLLNHVTLRPGEAVFLGAGNLHAYLHGAGVELMANSDNVVRGGLTPKHVDIEELLTVVDCTPVDPPVQRPAGPRHRYEVPVPEFGLERLLLAAGEAVALTPVGPEILLLTDGAANAGDVRLGRGQAAFVPAATPEYTLAAVGGPALAWRATTGGFGGARPRGN